MSIVRTYRRICKFCPSTILIHKSNSAWWTPLNLDGSVHKCKKKDNRDETSYIKNLQIDIKIYIIISGIV